MARIGPVFQGWEPFGFRKKAPNAASKRDVKAVNAARWAGSSVETIKKYNSESNKASSSTPGLNSKRLDEETEVLGYDRVSSDIKKAIVQGRLDKKITQAQLAQSDESCHNAATVKRGHKGKAKHAENDWRTMTEPCTTRKHLSIQTDAYLEELVENVAEYDIDTQTDSFLDRPSTPLFIPQKSGPDVGTQIEEGDLFNFEEEVEPMVEVLVGRTLEQAMMEVMEEKQIANLHAYQFHWSLGTL